MNKRNSTGRFSRSNSKRKSDPAMNAVQLMIAVKLMKEMAARRGGRVHDASRASRPAPNHAQLKAQARRRK